MAPETILLVGGPSDGQRVSHKGGDVYTVCVYPEQPVAFVMGGPVEETVTFTRAVYIRQRPSSTFLYDPNA